MFTKLFEGFANGGLVISSKMRTNGTNCAPVAAKIENGTNQRVRADPCPQRIVLENQLSILPVDYK
jgi:hypothetical protein